MSVDQPLFQRSLLIMVILRIGLAYYILTLSLDLAGLGPHQTLKYQPMIHHLSRILAIGLLEPIFVSLDSLLTVPYFSPTVPEFSSGFSSGEGGNPRVTVKYRVCLKYPEIPVKHTGNLFSKGRDLTNVHQ